MAVPSAITDLSTTVASNSPAGSESPSLIDDYLRAQAGFLAQMYSGNAPLLSSVAGTDTITGTVTPTPTAYAAGQVFRFISAGANTTTAVTLNVSSLGAKSVTKLGANALAAGDIPAGAVVQVVYDGTRFQIIGLTSQIAAAINTMTSPLTITVNGTTPITADTSGNISLPLGTANQVQYLNGSKVLSGSANLTFDGTTLTPNALTVTNAVTLNGGTANGVPYLNGSKVLTSGSALTFDGASLRLANAVGTTANGLRLDGGAQAHYWYLSDNVTSAYEIGSGSGQWKWLNSNGEQMRLTSTGLGIGTSSPGAKLNLYNASGNIYTKIESAADNNVGLWMVNNQRSWLWSTVGGGNGAVMLYDLTGSKSVMEISTSGNLGLGVTPSAWGSYKAFDVNSYGGLAASTSATLYSANMYFNGTNYIYKATSLASMYAQTSGQHQWYTAPSGTAGTAITFTQAMTLTAAGDLGIGATSPGAKLDIAGSVGRIIAPAATTASFQVYSNAKTTGGLLLAQGYGSGSDNIAWISNESNADLLFRTNATERARIDSSGNWLVNATGTITAGPNSKFISYAGSASTTAISAQYGNSFAGTLYRSDTYTAAGTGWYHFMGLSGNGSAVTTTQIQIFGNGNIQNTNNSYGAISDIKLKENIVDATPKLENLCKVRVVNYNLIGDYEQHKQIGVIAQEVEQIFPGIVEESPDRDAEGNDLGTMTKAVKYSVFVPMLIKAMQEQQALIESLTSRIAALEAK